jgi:hypothetical protein
MIYPLTFIGGALQYCNNSPWPESASELYQPSDRHLSAKLVSASADRGCHVVSVTDPCGCTLGFLNQKYKSTGPKLIPFVKTIESNKIHILVVQISGQRVTFEKFL